MTNPSQRTREMANGMYENGVIDATLLELLRDERKKALESRIKSAVGS